jgi:hypothetical protein
MYVCPKKYLLNLEVLPYFSLAIMASQFFKKAISVDEVICTSFGAVIHAFGSIFRLQKPSSILQLLSRSL